MKPLALSWESKIGIKIPTPILNKQQDQQTRFKSRVNDGVTYYRPPIKDFKQIMK